MSQFSPQIHPSITKRHRKGLHALFGGLRTPFYFTLQELVEGAPVKLKDLRELFYDTGIGKSAYSIMEQGKIDQILSTRPEDRRSLFEEAAGITRYKMRGREADRKLERTEANMREVDTVLAEIKRSYDTLKKQADKTQVYRELRERQFNLEVELQLARLVQFREQQESNQERAASFERQRDDIKGEIDRLNSRLESDLERVNTMAGRQFEVQKQLYGLELEKTSRTDRIALIREQRSQLDDRVEAEQGRLKGLQRKAEATEAAVVEAEAGARETARQIGEIDAGIGVVEERIVRSQNRQREARELIGANEGEIAGNDTETASRQRELRTVTDELVDALDSKLRESGYSGADRNRAEEELRTAVEHMTITLKGRRDSLLDRLAFQTGDAREHETVARSAFVSLEEAFERLSTAVARFQETVPRFLDDFLAPEGTITRKRSLDERIEVLQHQNQALRERNRELATEIENLQRTLETERAGLEQMRLNRVQLESRAVAQRETLDRYRRELEEHHRQSRELEERIGRDMERSRALEEQIGVLKGEHEALVTQERELKEELASLEERIALDNQSLKNEEEELKQKMQALARNQSRLEEVQVRLAEKRTEIRALYDGFSERHGRDLREFESREGAGAGDRKSLRESINEVRGRLKELGNVNLMAVEEFAEVSDRYEFLNAQLGDLRSARDDLVRVTAEIKRESEELFVETYNRIRKNFHTVFRRLFGGGRAELRLMDPDSVLDSGIDILVQPPGKKLENIALLSGGERSLTAVALLFATFMVRSSPFTLLDEIDAALDEHNVGRFVGMLNEFARQSQFIVITHNKKTVAGANTLLGVTMQESGVSRVVAVRIDGNGVDPVEGDSATAAEAELDLEGVE